MEGEQNTSAAVSEAQVPATQKKMGSMIPTLLTWVLSAFAFLAPVFAIPDLAVSLDASKAWLLAVAVFVGGLLVLVHLLLRGEISFPRHLILYALKGVALATLISALFSPHTLVSLMGTGAQIGTFSSILLFSLLAFLGMQAFRDRGSIFRFILALFASFTILSVFHVLRLFLGADFLSFGVFQSAAFSLAGKWNDFAVISGLILTLSMVAEYYFRQNILVLWASRVFAVLAVFFLLMIDFWVLWIVLAVIAGLFLLRTLARATVASGDAPPKRTFSFSSVSYAALVVLLLGVGFGFLFRFPLGDTTISQRVVSMLSPQPYAEIVLPPSLTFDIAKDVWKEGARTAAFGVGANRFSSAYFTHKPEGINNTPLWDSSFESGFSHITTFFVTGGILGLLAWLFLIIAVCVTVFAVLREERDGIRAYLGYSIGLGTLYLLIVSFVYLPNLSTFALLFLFMGVLVGMLVGEGRTKMLSISLPSAKGWGVALVPAVVLVAIGLSVWTFHVTRALRAETAYQNARNLANKGDIKGSLEEVSRAEILSARDSQYRLTTDLHLLELQRVLAEAPASAEALQNKVRELAGNASAAAEKAILFDPTNYLNYVSKASVGDLFATLNVDRVTTATVARDAYIDAVRLNPSSPRLEFAIGRVELLLDNREGAKLHLGKARDLRPAYPEAIAALAELSRQDGDIGKAIDIATAGLQSDPSNFIISFQLGFLYYSNQDYDRAIAALSNAIAINPYYADAKYFLGIAYARKGDKEAAMKQFEEIRTLNPGNTEIVRVIRNLSQGRDPLQDQ